MSCGQPKTSFVDSELAQLEWVLESVWATLGEVDESTKARVRRKLFLLACNGVNDPDALRDRLVASVARMGGETRPN